MGINICERGQLWYDAGQVFRCQCGLNSPRAVVDSAGYCSPGADNSDLWQTCHVRGRGGSCEVRLLPLSNDFYFLGPFEMDSNVVAVLQFEADVTPVTRF